MASRLDTPAGPVSLAYDLPAAHRPAGAPAVILAHGAGSDMHSTTLVRTAHALAAAGFAVCRFNFAYREAGRRLPDRLPALIACYAAVVARVGSDPMLEPPWMVIGGRSLGGRVASHLAAEGAAVRGLLLLAFPLHPAGKPAVARAAHLPTIGIPTLFVQGTRDALAEWALIEPLVRTLPTATLHVVDDADHSLAVPKRTRSPASVDREVDDAVIAWLRGLPASRAQ